MTTTQEQLSPQAAFDQGSKQILESKHQDAINSLKGIKQTGFTSEGLESNLGRSLTDSQLLGEGLLSLQNAVALNRWSSDARHDLRLAQERVPNGWGTPMNHPTEWAHRTASYIRPLELVSSASILFIILLSLNALRVRLSPAIKTMSSVLLILLLGGAALTYSSASLAIVKIATDLRGSPLSSSEKIQDLPAGTRVRVIRTSGHFSEVERSNALKGWIASDQLSRLPY